MVAVCVARNARHTLMFVVGRFPHGAFGWVEASVVRSFAQRCLSLCFGQVAIVRVRLRVQSGGKHFVVNCVVLVCEVMHGKKN